MYIFVADPDLELSAGGRGWFITQNRGEGWGGGGCSRAPLLDPALFLISLKFLYKFTYFIYLLRFFRIKLLLIITLCS